MTPATLNIIRATLDAEPGMTSTRRQEILQAMAVDVIPRVWISEGEASDVLGISRAQLCRWRNHQIPSAEPFPFNLWQPPLNAGIKYDRAEVESYIRGRLAQSTTPKTERNPVTVPA